MTNFLIFWALKVNEIFDNTFLIVLCVLIFALFFMMRKNYFLFSVLSVFVAEILIFSLKNIFQVARPDNPLIEVSGYAMPSGHAGNSFLISTLLTFYVFKTKLKKPLKILLATIFNIVALAISASRIILGVHTITQVIAGALVGIFVPIVVLQIMKFKKHKVS
jgi:membrane-associated phospholipid phosphatase